MEASDLYTFENKKFTKSTASISPDADKIRDWAKCEQEYFNGTQKKLADIEANGAPSPLNDELFGIFDDLIDKYSVPVSRKLFASILPSVRSALGISSERLLGVYGGCAVRSGLHGELHGSKKDQAGGPGAQTVPTSAGLFQNYIMGNAFKNTIHKLRDEHGKDPTADAAAIEEAAKKFFVDVETIRSLVRNSKNKISYPDSVSIFENEVRVAQHKLSGETDSNNTEANVKLLLDQCKMFAHLNRKVAAIVILPFSKPGVENRWTREFKRQIEENPHVAHLETEVYTNAEVFRGLFGECQDADKVYEDFRKRIALVGANRLFAAFAPANLSTDGFAWYKDDADAAAENTVPRTYSITVPRDLSAEKVEAFEALLELARSMGATAEIS